MRSAIVLWGAVLWALSAAGGAEEAPDADALRVRIRAYLDAPRDAEAKNLLRALASVKGVAPDRWAELIRTCRRGVRAKPGEHTGTLVLPDAVVRRIEKAKQAPPGEKAALIRLYRQRAGIELKWDDKLLFPDGARIPYAVRVPSGYDPEQPHPLILCLHGAGAGGAGGAGCIRSWSNAAGRLDEAGAILIAPTTPAHIGWGDCLASHEICRAALREAVRRFYVDPDAVYVDGTSIGGAGAWRLVTAHPDWFAGAVVRAGVPPAAGAHARMANGAGLHLWIYHGRNHAAVLGHVRRGVAAAENAGLRVALRLFPKVDHGYFRDHNAEILSDLLKARRTALPRKVRLLTNTEKLRRNHWIEINQERLAGRQSHTLLMTEKMEVLERRMTWLQNREVAAEAVPGNELRLDVKLVSQVRVYLAPGTLDLGRPVRIRVNGRLQGVRQARPSVRFMLEEYRRAGGLYPVYYAKVEIPTW